MFEYVTLPAPLKWSYGNKAKRYSERIVAEAKQESLLLCMKITPLDYSTTSLFYDSVVLSSKPATLSSHSMMTRWLILYILVAHKDDVTNYIHSNTGHHVWILPIALVVYRVTCSLVHRIQCAPGTIIHWFWIGFLLFEYASMLSNPARYQFSD